MKSFLNMFLLLLSAALVLNSCSNPFKDLDIRVDTNVFKYTTMIEVASSTGQSMDNATVTLQGPDADKIYNTDGRKEFKISGGLLLLALDPKVQPTPGQPVRFSVNIAADNYLTVNVPVTIAADINSSMQRTVMINTSRLPEGLNVKTSTVALSENGTTTAPVTLTTATGSGVTETVSIALPAGTAFRDASGNAVSAGNLAVSTIVANTSSNEVLSLFPGGSLALPEVVTSNGSTTAGTLLPAALTEISMNAGGTPVKSFSQPIEITLQLDQNYHNPKTNAVIKEGDQLDVYSYSADNGVWTFENTGTVVNAAGKLALKTATTHLTWFTAASMVPSCNNTYSVKFNAGWLANDLTHPVTYKVFSSADQKLLTQGVVTVANGTEALVGNLPSSAVTMSFYDVEGNVLATQALTNPCSAPAMQAITLNPSPLAGNPKVTMQLYVRCPNNAQPVTLLPTFYLYYKESGQRDSEYKMLGTVTKGYISTTLLSTSKTYAFKAVWGSYVKVVGPHTVQVDNSATVGDGPNELIGTKAGATNLAVLREVCSQNGY